MRLKHQPSIACPVLGKEHGEARLLTRSAEGCLEFYVLTRQLPLLHVL